METEQMVTCNASRLPEFSTGQSVGAFVGVAGDGMDQPFEQGSGKTTRAVPCPVTVGNGTWIFYYYFSLCFMSKVLSLLVRVISSGPHAPPVFVTLQCSLVLA